MKNIHLIPTDKPSRLFKSSLTNRFGFEKLRNIIRSNRLANQNIYITSSEEIKDGDKLLILRDGLLWGNKGGICTFIRRQPSNHGFDKAVAQSSNGTIFTAECDIEYAVERGDVSKIILTDNKDLIKDGVQAIDDELLEWFAKNPSCEEVKIENDYLLWKNSEKEKLSDCYKIIIPKEDPKPHSFCETPQEKCTMNYCDENGCQNRKRELVEEPKQETSVIEDLKDILNHVTKMNDRHQNKEILEEAAESYTPVRIEQKAFIAGAKFQQKQMYSEEDMINFAWWLTRNLGQFSDDKEAHFKGKYFDMWAKEIKKE